MPQAIATIAAGSKPATIRRKRFVNAHATRWPKNATRRLAAFLASR